MNFEAHLERLKAAAGNVYGVGNLAPWIEKHTYLNSNAYSFAGYEYQKAILEDSARTTITIKPAQTGVSELSYRYAVALCCTQDDFSLIYTFPSSSDAEKNCRTRIDPMIQGSPELKRLINPEMNNSEMKQFGRNSFLFFKGTRSATQALSTPANCIIHDEYDASDITQASVYVSRLQNRPHKLRKLFSTPTVDKYGISKEAETAKRYRQFATCEHCNERFMPDYFEHVKIPGWSKKLEEITKSNLHLTKWRKAELKCPRCGLNPNLHHSRMEFVCENANEDYEAHAYYITPFSVPEIIVPSYLVEVSTKFERYSEFKNQALGLTGEESNEAILESDIVGAEMAGITSSEMHVMGSDMGLTCHICVGRLTLDGTLLIVHRQQVHYTEFEQVTQQLAIKFRVVLHVMDSQPYTDLVSRLSKSRPNNWGAIFVNTKSPVPFTLQTETEDKSEGKMELKLAKVNRTAALDSLLNVIKTGMFKIEPSEQNELYREQLQSLKRVQKFTKDGELTYVWDKTDGNDHFHFATLYLHIATLMRGTAGGIGALGAGLPILSRSRGPKQHTHGGATR